MLVTQSTTYLGTAPFFEYAQERYRIHLRRREAELAAQQGEVPQGPPWTEDDILQQYRFCNVFREDDKVTRWVRDHVNHARQGEALVGAMAIARWFNRIETLDKIEWGYPRAWTQWALNLDEWEANMRNLLNDVSPLVTAAYMVKTPAGKNKLDGILWALRQFLPNAVAIFRSIDEEHWTLEAATNHLTIYPYLGPFMAYEIVTDLRHTPLMRYAKDKMTWANPGPGCARGAGRVVKGDPGMYNRHSSYDLGVLQRVMQNLLVCSQDDVYWPTDWPDWEMRDVEHTLCEFDKYERARLGEGAPKQRYNGGG